MQVSRFHLLPLLGALGGLLLPALGQQESAPDFGSSSAASRVKPFNAEGTNVDKTDPALFPSSGGNTAVPDLSGSEAAAASQFGTPDFSRGSTSVPSLSGAGGGSGTGVTGTPGSVTGTGANAGGSSLGGTGGGFAPGPFSSPASTTPTTPNGVAAPAADFGTTALGNGTGLGAGAGSGTAGLGGANTRTPQPSTPASFSLPGAYGQAPLSFAAGQGRLARPRYVFTLTSQVGYDDNILQTPTALQGSPPVLVDVLVEPEVPDRTVRELVTTPGPHPIGVKPALVYRTRVIKGHEARYDRVLVSPGIDPQERIGSVVARAGVGFEMQLSNRRTVFTLDAHVNENYFFDRPDDQDDLNGNIGLIYAYRFSPRLQVSTALSLAYLSQADVRIVSGPTRNVGDFLTVSSKTDLSYEWSHRISTVTSLSYNSLHYQNKIQSVNDSDSFTLGTEGRYRYNGKLTLVLETRASQVVYSENELRDSSSYFLLVGADFAYSRRLSATIRVGEALRSFDDSGDTRTAPYLETTTAYRFSPRGSLSWSNRFGFEEPQDATSDVLVFRTSLSAVEAFTARLRGSASVGFIHRTTSYDSSVNATDITGSTYTVDLGLDYAITKKFSVNASYSFVSDLSSLEGNDYYRNQIFLGGQYTF